MFPKMQQYVKSHQVLTILASLVLLYAVYNYSSSKSMFPEYMSGSSAGSNKRGRGGAAAGQGNGSAGRPPAAVDDSTIYNQLNSATGSSNMVGLPPNCSGQANINPADLLPKDNNSSWNMKPMGSGDFLGVNLLNAGYLIGVDTIGSSLRNANLQVRSEPPNPQLQVSPWMNTTIEPDPFRAPLEIGCGPKPCSS